MSHAEFADVCWFVLNFVGLSNAAEEVMQTDNRCCYH